MAPFKNIPRSSLHVGPTTALHFRSRAFAKSSLGISSDEIVADPYPAEVRGAKGAWIMLSAAAGERGDHAYRASWDARSLPVAVAVRVSLSASRFHRMGWNIFSR